MLITGQDGELGQVCELLKGEGILAIHLILCSGQAPPHPHSPEGFPLHLLGDTGLPAQPWSQLNSAF